MPLRFHGVGEGEDKGRSVDLHKADVPYVALKGNKLLGEGQEAVNGLLGVPGGVGQSESIQEFLAGKEELTLLLQPSGQLQPQWGRGYKNRSPKINRSAHYVAREKTLRRGLFVEG